MKKIPALIAAAIFCFSAAACGVREAASSSVPRSSSAAASHAAGSAADSSGPESSPARSAPSSSSFASSAAASEASSAASVSPASETSASASSAGKTETELSSLTLEQKIGQMFFLAFRKDAAGNPLLSPDDASLETLRSIQPGGVVLFGENIRTTEQVRELIGSVRNSCALPPFFAVDQEGGTVQRISRTDLIPATTIPPMRDVGRTGNLLLARKIGGVIGSELGVFGFNMDFAPVCDVFSNPQNTVIGTRSFSSDPQQAADFSCALSEGLRSEGIIPVCKHFPGHGDTALDTHAGRVSLSKTLDELRRTELVPFRAQIAAGAEVIMAAHISLPEISGNDAPATMLPEVIGGILRGELGFRGVVVTDSLSMGAVTQYYSSGEAAVLAVKAGADMLLMPDDPAEAKRALLAAVKRGEISAARIDESAARILALKKKYGLWESKPPADESLLGCAEHLRIAEEISKEASP